MAGGERRIAACRTPAFDVSLRFARKNASRLRKTIIPGLPTLAVIATNRREGFRPKADSGPRGTDPEFDTH
ncbi:hypothetical protein [Paraburkholderia unamae]|uniref:hypothetical protein n=1 Tax=Paraburkholderia unamae TaxID=219649 RepID=UPI00105823B9|nr:hypothetical protein [Paraburkholderia unamae]CAG9246313.1 hypothetical protein PUN4_1150015 [Paraburkholderia unamae]